MNVNNFIKNLNEYMARFSMFLRQIRGTGRRAMLFDTAQFFAVIFVGIVVILVIADYMIKVSFQISEQRQLAAKNISRIDSLSSLQRQYNDLKDIIPKVNALLPNEDGVAFFLARLDNLSDITGAGAIIKIGQKELTIAGTNIYGLPVNISFNGNFDAAMRYIGELEKLPYVVRIDGLNITGGKDINKSSQIQIAARLFIKSSQ